MVAGTNSLLDNLILLSILHWGILIILFFYAIFALIIVRQVDIMSRTLITPFSPILKAIAIIHAGFAIGFIFLVYGIL